MPTTLLVLAFVAQVLLVPVVGMAAVGVSEWANSHGPKVLGPIAALLGRSGVFVTVALIRSLTGAGDGMLVAAWAPPGLMLLLGLVSADAVRGDRPASALRTMEIPVAVFITAVPALLILAAQGGA